MDYNGRLLSGMLLVQHQQRQNIPQSRRRHTLQALRLVFLARQVLLQRHILLVEESHRDPLVQISLKRKTVIYLLVRNVRKRSMMVQMSLEKDIHIVKARATGVVEEGGHMNLLVEEVGVDRVVLNEGLRPRKAWYYSLLSFLRRIR